MKQDKRPTSSLSRTLACVLLAGCASRPEYLENSVLRDVSDGRVVVESRWGLLGLTAAINERDAKAIIGALNASGHAELQAEPQPSARAMVSPELGPAPRAAGTSSDPRVCHADLAQIPRDASGEIVRSSAVLAEFQRIWPCPATGLHTGACPGWAKDHVIPRASGGCDAVSNLQWLPVGLKSCRGVCKDRWERGVYAPGAAP